MVTTRKVFVLMPDSAQPAYDACVIGAGPGGYVAAIRLAQRGQRVALIERHALGGTCLNWGCIPSKALIHAADTLESLRSVEKMGILLDTPPRLDFPRLIGWKDGLVHKLQGGIRHLLEAHGVCLIEGEATFVSPHQLEIRPPQGEPFALEAAQYLIATGSGPQAIATLPIDGRFVLDVRDLLALQTLPARLAVVGGGVIGLEMAMAFARLGSQVTLVEALPTLLPSFDPDCRQVLLRALKRRKITLKTGVSATWVSSDEAHGVTLSLSPAQASETGSSDPHTLTVDRVLVAVGRTPNTAGLGLAQAGLAGDSQGYIAVDAQCRTQVRHLFAIGDVTRGPLLAHRASHDGLIAAAVMAGDTSAQLDTRAMPMVVYTDPELAAVGLSEAEAQAQGRAVRVGTFPMAASGRAMTLQATEGLVKLIADAATDELLGAHIAGPQADTLVAEAALAMELGATAGDLALTVHAHPTLNETLMEAAEAVHRQAIHVFQK